MKAAAPSPLYSSFPLSFSQQSGNVDLVLFLSHGSVTGTRRREGESEAGMGREGEREGGRGG